jgi:hypothetical protein
MVDSGAAFRLIQDVTDGESADAEPVRGSALAVPVRQTAVLLTQTAAATGRVNATSLGGRIDGSSRIDGDGDEGNRLFRVHADASTHGRLAYYWWSPASSTWWRRGWSNGCATTPTAGS